MPGRNAWLNFCQSGLRPPVLLGLLAPFGGITRIRFKGFV
ncbi:MAG: hypothetical protein QOE34_1694 [Verrucomicrobiota bacterium]|jgi:hypothetical protein